MTISNPYLAPEVLSLPAEKLAAAIDRDVGEILMKECSDCVDVKPTRNTHTRCHTCGKWRKMTPQELKRVSNRG